jgi:hypothetical protein
MALTETLAKCQRAIRGEINSTYQLQDNGGIATHYLWRAVTIQSVWTKKSGRARIELEPTKHDYDIAGGFADYRAKTIRPMRLFDNSRINSRCSLTVSDLLTGRAQHNIDLIQQWIDSATEDQRNALRACLTSAIGQMSKMVFAITGRGKTNGNASSKIEVGSWIIGYWRPELHFEINVWDLQLYKSLDYRALCRCWLVLTSIKERPPFRRKEFQTMAGGDLFEALNTSTAGFFIVRPYDAL